MHQWAPSLSQFRRDIWRETNSELPWWRMKKIISQSPLIWTWNWGLICSVASVTWILSLGIQIVVWKSAYHTNVFKAYVKTSAAAFEVKPQICRKSWRLTCFSSSDAPPQRDIFDLLDILSLIMLLYHHILSYKVQDCAVSVVFQPQQVIFSIRYFDISAKVQCSDSPLDTSIIQQNEPCDWCIIISHY